MTVTKRKLFALLLLAAALPVLGTGLAAREMPEAGQTAEQAALRSGGTDAPYRLAVRANLLRWATLAPDAGAEWRISRSVGVAVDGTWTSWCWSGKDRRYALWEVNPEVRWYLGEAKRWYVGAAFKAGSFNYKLSGTGRQGDLTGGGATGGCRLDLGRALSLDFSLGLGCVHADYEEYEVVSGVRVRRGDGTRNWWGPTQAGVTLVWKLF